MDFLKQIQTCASCPDLVIIHIILFCNVIIIYKLLLIYIFYLRVSRYWILGYGSVPHRSVSLQKIGCTKLPLQSLFHEISQDFMVAPGVVMSLNYL
ncbi:hypothetical protein P8452_44214 [Trifolium repens]|nr:hypothetical protein P8452_44214 [Trifolium repens]